LASGVNEKKMHDEFPVCNTAPVIVTGTPKKGTGKAFVGLAYTEDEIKEVAEEAASVCKPSTIRIIGVWPGKWNTDVFDLNVGHYGGIKVPRAKKPKKK